MRLLVCPLLVCCGGAFAGDWPQFRGPDSQSVAEALPYPLDWEGQNESSWVVELPGRGPSSPIVVGDRVLITCSAGYLQDDLYVLCFDAADGTQRWRRQFWATGRTFSHPFSANAAPTPASDGRFVVAFFSSNDLVCLDLEGNLQWYRGLAHDYPHAGNDAGMSASPLIVGDTVVVQVECQSDSFAAGIDLTTGETRWRIDRPHEGNWTSPIALAVNGGRQRVLLQSPTGLTAHDVKDGRELWRYEAACGTIASPVTVGETIYFPCNGLTALKYSRDDTPPELAWNENLLRPGYSSPVVNRGEVYTLQGGILRCGDAETGAVLWRLRLEGNYWATPVVAGNYLYCLEQSGLVKVVDREKNEVVATRNLGETLLASPAISRHAMYIRSDGHLWKIAAPQAGGE